MYYITVAVVLIWFLFLFYCPLKAQDLSLLLHTKYKYIQCLFILDRKKKGKGGPLFRSEKKDKSMDSNSPAGIKQKHSVHGVVGPADYIFDHGGSPPNETSTVTTNMQGFVQPNQTVQLQNPNQASLNTVSQAASPWPNQPVPQPVYKQPTVPLPKPSISNPPAPSFQPNFPPTMSTKVERPHSSAALLQDRQSPQTPTPFKQPQNVTPQKSTLLAQAMGSNYGQVLSYKSIVIQAKFACNFVIKYWSRVTLCWPCNNSNCSPTYLKNMAFCEHWQIMLYFCLY